MSLHPKPRDLDQVRTVDPIELSSSIIDTGVADEPANRVTNTLAEIADDVAVVEWRLVGRHSVEPQTVAPA